jgi:hypothetical protein
MNRIAGGNGVPDAVHETGFVSALLMRHYIRERALHDLIGPLLTPRRGTALAIQDSSHQTSVHQASPPSLT